MRAGLRRQQLQLRPALRPPEVVAHPDDVAHDAALLRPLHAAAVGGVAVGDDDEDAAGARPGPVLGGEDVLRDVCDGGEGVGEAALLPDVPQQSARLRPLRVIPQGEHRLRPVRELHRAELPPNSTTP